MWDLPGSGIKSVSPALASWFFITEPPGKPWGSIFIDCFFCCISIHTLSWFHHMIRYWTLWIQYKVYTCVYVYVHTLCICVYIMIHYKVSRFYCVPMKSDFCSGRHSTWLDPSSKSVTLLMGSSCILDRFLHIPDDAFVPGHLGSPPYM